MPLFFYYLIGITDVHIVPVLVTEKVNFNIPDIPFEQICFQHDCCNPNHADQ